MSKMLKSSGAMAAATLLSRILGMVREMAYASFMGDGVVASAFKVAFMIPNMFRRFLGEGALTAAFIPLFKEKEETEGEEAMWNMANAVISGLILSTTVIVALAILGITLFLWGGTLSLETRLLLDLTRWTFPYLPFVCLAALFMSMLNSKGSFFLPSLGATLLNVVMIVTVFWIAPWATDGLEEGVYLLAGAVVVAGVLQAFFQFPALYRRGFRWHWVPPWQNSSVKLIVQKMIPGMLGITAFHLNVLVSYGIAFREDPVIAASFDYAVRLMEFPQGVLGVSLASFLLPTLSGFAAKKRYEEFRGTLFEGLHFLLFANLFAAGLLWVLAQPMVRLLFERGAFDAGSTIRVAAGLASLAPALVAYSIVIVMARAFYALGDTKTPMYISSFCLMVNVFLVFWMVPLFRQAGMGWANSVSSWVNAILLMVASTRVLKHSKGDFPDFLWNGAKMTAIAGGATGATWWTSVRWERAFEAGGFWTLKVCGLVLPMAMGCLIYFVLSYLFKVPAVHKALRALGVGEETEG